MAITIEFVGGPRDGQTERFSGNTVTVGRDSDSDVVFAADRTVSRQHARVVRDGDQYFVQDVGSSHGTFVDGVQVTGQTRRAVEAFQPVRVGASWFAVRAE